MGNEVDILPANEHKSFLQDNSINLGVRTQAYPKYPKQVRIIFAISQGKRSG